MLYDSREKFNVLFLKKVSTLFLYREIKLRAAEGRRKKLVNGLPLFAHLLLVCVYLVFDTISQSLFSSF